MYYTYILHETREIIISTREKFNALPELLQELAIVIVQTPDLETAKKFAINSLFDQLKKYCLKQRITK